MMKKKSSVKLAAPPAGATPPTFRRCIRELPLRTELLGGIGRTTLRRIEEDNPDFPRARHLTERIRVWDLDAVEAWLAGRGTAWLPLGGAK